MQQSARDAIEGHKQLVRLAQDKDATSRTIDPELLEEMVEVRRSWFRWFGLYNVIHHVVGGASVVGAVLLGSKQPFVEIYASYISIAVAVCTATVTYYQASSKARAFNTAWRVLGKAVDDYKSHRLGAPELRDARNKCESDILGGTGSAY
jgi:hypothetical protein